MTGIIERVRLEIAQYEDPKSTPALRVQALASLETHALAMARAILAAEDLAFNVEYYWFLKLSKAPGIDKPFEKGQTVQRLRAALTSYRSATRAKAESNDV